MSTNDNHKTTKERFIEIDGEQIPVTEEVYFAFKRPAWRERKRKERERRCLDENSNRCIKNCRVCDLERAKNNLPPMKRDMGNVSIERLKDDGFELADPFVLEELVAEKIMLEELAAALGELNQDDRALVDALFFKEMTERDYANEINITHQGVNRRKQRVLKNLRRLSKINCKF